jgi:hypothetical protein
VKTGSTTAKLTLTEQEGKNAPINIASRTDVGTTYHLHGTHVSVVVFGGWFSLWQFLVFTTSIATAAAAKKSHRPTNYNTIQKRSERISIPRFERRNHRSGKRTRITQCQYRQSGYGSPTMEVWEYYYQ